MSSKESKTGKDSAEETLALYQKEEQEFRGHPVWKQLNCTPEEFFSAVKKHVASLNVPPQKWNEAYQKARDASRVRSAERRSTFQPVKLKMLGALRA